MEMKYYNASNNFKAPIPREPKPYKPPEPIYSEIIIPKVPQEENPIQSEESIVDCEDCNNIHETKVLTKVNQDDYILLGLILLLLVNGCDDYLLLLVLGYILINGKHI